VNIRSRDEIRASADLLANVVNLFVRASYAARVNAASLTERAEIISSLSKIYFCDYYIDLERDRFLELDSTDELRAFIGSRRSSSALLADASRYFAMPEFHGESLKFTDLGTLSDRLGDRTSIAHEFICRNGMWCRSVFIAVNRGEGGRISHVIFAHAAHPGREGRGAADTARAEGGRRAGQPGQPGENGLSLPHEPRHPHAAQRHHRHDVSGREAGQSAQDGGLPGQDRRLVQVPAGPHQRHPGHGQGGERKDRAAPGALSRRRSFTLYRRGDPPLLPGKAPALFGGRRMPRRAGAGADKLRINQVVFNLLSNAVKYTPEGGTIAYRARFLRTKAAGCTWTGGGHPTRASA
jgi:hypothetical protein